MASKIGTYCVNLLHPSISLRILNTALYTFRGANKEILFNNQEAFSGLLFPLFS